MAEKLSILNPHPTRLPGPSLLHHLVATHGKQHAIAIDYQSADGESRQVSYEDLHRRSDLLSVQLQSVWQRSSRPENAKFIVPLFIAQSPDLYVAQLAVLKAGAAFCPMSLDVPEERLRFILKDVDARILLTTSSLRGTLSDLDGVTVLSADEELQGRQTETCNLNIDASSPAYIMYTSGSTGQPKGVVLSHLAATQALLAHDRHIPPFSRFLQFASPTFDVSVFEIFFPFFRRSTLVCGERRQLLSDLPGFINRANIDACELTPSVASSLLQGRSSVPKLRTLLTIGEMLKHDVVEEFGGSHDGDCVLHGMYGPTEATIHCTLQPSFRKDMSVGNIGVPLDTVSAFIVKPLETDGNAGSAPEIVSIGEEGELAVGGHQLADGYLNRPEQTRAAFVQHPEYGLLYRTGDRAKLTGGGRLECMGRISSGQVKLRGQRIELGEIEHAASKTPGCQTAIAEVVSGTLIVFLTGDVKQLSQSKILETCRKWLPAFMIPGDTMILEALPYLPSGKTDRKALHAVYHERIAEVHSADEKISDRLSIILDVMQPVLSAPIRPSSQLATVGLDSLSAIRIASQLRKAGFSSLDATTLLDAQTPREIEEAISILENDQEAGLETGQEEDARSELYRAVSGHTSIHARMDEVEEVFLPTSVQSAMLAETARDSIAYCNWVELSVPENATVKRIEASLVELARRHPLLRSGFLPLVDSASMHAVITWKSMLPTQIQLVDRFSYHFAIGDEEALLRACSFQILHSEAGNRVLVLIHHALYDQWSMDILRSDLGSLLSGAPIEVSHSFSQISAYHQSLNNNARIDSSVDFWQDQLREFSPTLLPLMTSKRSQSALMDTNWQPLGQDVGKVRSTAQSIGCSAPAVFQAALAYLLGSYVGSTDVTYGTVFSGRHLPIEDIERIFGPCLSTMPVRLDYGATRSVQDLLRLVHERNRSIQKHSLLPLSKIRSAAGLTPDTKLFDVLFVWQESGIFSDSDETAVHEVDSADQYEFNLVIEFEPKSDGLRARAMYQRSLITEQQVTMMLQQVSILANAMLESTEMLVEDLSQALPGSSLSIWNPSPSSCATGHDLLRTIEHHATVSPRSPALRFARRFDDRNDSVQTVSYDELNSRANRMAHYLVSLKNSPSEQVCICMEKSVELYVATLATLKAGCGYLPLLPDTPSARVASVMRQSEVKLCVCDESSRAMMSGMNAVKTIDVTSTDLGSCSSENLPSTMSGSEIAYTVFTSGSTGEPKGVAVTVENLLGNLEALKELYKVQSGDRLLQACSQAFDVSVFEIFFAFYTGISLCSATNDVLFDDLEASIRSFGVTHLSLTPTVAALIDPANVPSVKFLVTAGEAVTELVHERWAGRGLHQGYGPSETTNICTINMNVQPSDVLGNIGPPFLNTSAIVLAPRSGFNVLPAGAVGEFAFGGEQVFRGYVGMDELNAEKIYEHPDFGRVYKSGDVGRILHDGTLLISGRLDDQVKVRGNRIELGEIDAALLRSSLIRDCSTLVVGESAIEQDLVSFAVLQGIHDSSSETLQVVVPGNQQIERLFIHLEDSLPSYMVPSMIIAMNRLPLTSQGKLDRRSLKQLLAQLDSEQKAQVSRNAGLSSGEEDWSDTERIIANTLANGLSIPPSSVLRNAAFFGLGLNSLNAISFSKHLAKALETPINPGMVLRNASVSRLARSIEHQKSQDPIHEGSTAPTRLLPDELVSEVRKQLKGLEYRIENVLPCTPLQEAMVSASAAGGSSYCNTTWLDISGDVEKLKQCWHRMVERHEILRTRFIDTQSPTFPVVQVVLADCEAPFVQQTPSAAGSEDIENPRVNPQHPFEIELHISSDKAKLALHMHHAIYDGISMARLLQEVEFEYWGECLPPTVAFSEFLRQAEDHNTPEAMEFWSRRLAGLQPSPFPQSEPKNSLDENAMHSRINVKSAQVESFCKRYSVTPLSVFQAALVKLLAFSQSITDICIGNVVSGRSMPVEGIERLVAPCFNTIPVRANLGRMRANLDLIRSLVQDNIQSLEYQLSPLRRLQGLSPDPSKRLFDALLLLQPSETGLDGSIWRFEKDTGCMGLPLVLEITPSSGDFMLTLHHLEAVISQSLAHDLGRAFLAAVKSCLEYPNSGLSNFHGDMNIAIHGILAPKHQSKAINGRADTDEGDGPDDWTGEEALVRDTFAHFANVNIRRIFKNTSMYQLGLDSLNASQIASHLRSNGHSVDAADVMEALTPRLIARMMQSKEQRKLGQISLDLEGFDQRHRNKIVRDLSIRSEDVLKVRPCTSVQNGMIAQSLHSYGGLYINHVTYKLPAHVDFQRLRLACKDVMNKHELLRAAFFNLHDPETPFATVVRRSEIAEVPLNILDGNFPLSAIEQQARKAIVDDMAVSPWRITLSSNDQHMLTLSIHHALYDAESLQIILSDLQQALQDSSIGESLNVDDLLASTITSEREAVGSSAAENFWTTQMERAGYVGIRSRIPKNIKLLIDDSFVKFPDLTPTIVARSDLGVEVFGCNLSMSEIENFCRENGATIQALGQTVWALLLSVYAGETAVTFGTVFSGRSNSPSSQTAFPSVVTVPVPCNTEQNPLEVLDAMVTYNAAMQRYRSTPLADIQRFAGSPGRSLFDTVFVYQKTSTDRNAFEWHVVRETAAVDYAASLELEVDDWDGLQIRLTFDTARIPPTQAGIMVQQYDMLLSDMVYGRSSNHKSTPSLYSALAPKVAEIPSGVELLQQFVEKSARQYPNRKALEFVTDLDGETPTLHSWTYSEFDATSNQIAHAILAAGGRTGSVVALSMDKCPEATFAFVAILKAGCSFLALDPDLPQDRVTFILEDSKSSVLLTSGSKHGPSTPNGLPILNINLKGLDEFPTFAPNLTQATCPEDTCYVLYTSGTTGAPKGCEITHENAVQAMLSFQRLFSGHWTDRSRWLQFASYWFDVSVLEQFWSWSVGISVVGAPRDIVLEDIPGFIRAMDITHIDLTPSLARLVHPDEVPSLWGGVFITGGEALKQEIIDAWGSKHTICNGYGPTEATIGVTMNTFIGPDAKPSNIGPAFDNVGAYVLNPSSGEPVIRGGVGELCVSGKLVGKGYLNRPDLTAKQFPSVAELGERIYRTGDLVRLLSDDSVQFIGRKDTQAKLRGQRLEIAEIDAVIQRSTGKISDVVSLVVKNEHGRETLVSFVTYAQRTETRDIQLDTSASSHDLVREAQSACEKKLPGYMIPTHILPLSLLPLTVNNKVDAKRLTKIFEGLDTKSLQSLKPLNGDVRPLNHAEREICKALSRMFPIQLDQAQSSSNLFSLGLSSISAISFASVLKQAGFERANVATIMKNQTVRELAAALSDTATSDRRGDEDVQQARLAINAYTQRYRSAAAKALQIRIEDIEIVTPCSPLQQGLILESLRDDSHPYFNWFNYELCDVSLDELETACHSLVSQVQVLRSSFVGLEDGHGQVVQKKVHAPILRWTIPSKSVDDAILARRQDWIRSNSSELIAPLEMHIVKSPSLSFLIVHIHHALYDGISYELIMGQLWRIYSSDSTPASGPSFTDALPFGPLKQTSGSENFWRQRLQASNFAPIPVKAADNVSSPMEHRSVLYPEKLEQKRQEMGVSHQAMAQAAFEVALRQYVGTKFTQVYGVVVSGRSIDLENADRVLGPMFNTLPQPIVVDPAATLQEHTRRCQNMNAETLPHQHTPLRDIRKWTRARPGSPMFDVLFVFQHVPKECNPSFNKSFNLTSSQSRAEYPLVCEVELGSEGQFDLSLLAQGKYFVQEDLHQLMSTLEDVFTSLLTNEQGTLGESFGIEKLNVATSASVINGIANELNGVEYFEWTREAVAIRDIVAQIAGLDTEDIDEHTSVFSVGLDSIDVVKLASRLKGAGLLLPVSEILRAQTIPRMLHRLQKPRNLSHGHGDSQLKGLEQSLNRVLAGSLHSASLIERILPATPNQEALVADMLRADFMEYFNHDILRLDNEISLDKLKSAWQKVIDASPILRTSFVQVQDPKLRVVFAQVVHSAAPIDFGEIRLASEIEIDSHLDTIRRDVSTSSEKRPPFRLTVASFGSERYLILSIAHGLYDGHSLALLHKDVRCAYIGKFEARPAYDNAVEASLTAVEEESRQFWVDAMSGARAQTFPKSSKSADDKIVHRAEVKSHLSAEAARSFCQRQGVSMQALAQTCWTLTLAHYTQTLEVLFGVVIACRDSEEAENVMFPMMNTVVMRSALHGTRSDMLRYMQSSIAEMLPYQRTPLRTIQKVCNDVVDHASPDLGAALFDTLFIYQHRPNSSREEGEALYKSVGGSSSVEYSVAVEMEVVDDAMTIRAACKGKVLDQEGAEKLVRVVDTVLERLIKEPDCSTVDLKDVRASICGLKAFDLQSQVVQGSGKGRQEVVQATASTVSSPTINTILQAFAEVSDTKLADLNASSTIESIGIDSISAIKVASLLRNRDIKLSVSDIIRSKSARRMAELVSQQSDQPKTTAPASEDVIRRALAPLNLKTLARGSQVEPTDVETWLPATAGQAYMLSMWKKTHGQIFDPTFTYRLQADVSEEAIQRAWNALVDRHPILRTILVITGDKAIPVVQLVLKSGTRSSPSRQLPLVSLETRRKDSFFELGLHIHHTLYDAVSLPLLLDDLERLLAGRPLSYSKTGQQDLLALSLTPVARSRQKIFWTSYLRDITPIKLPQPALDGPQSKVEMFKPGLFAQAIQLDAGARKRGISVQAVLFAAYAKVYTSFPAKTGVVATDVVLGIYLSNRSHLPELDSLAAPTLNLVPLLVRSPKSRSLLDVAIEIQKDLQEIGSPENSATGLWEIAEWTGVKVDTFVNFLKLPESVENESLDREVVIEEVSDRRVKERRQVVAPDRVSNFRAPAGLRESGVVNAYQHSVDVEMMVTDGKLDVGLFAPLDMVSLEEADEVFVQLKKLLDGVFEETSG